MSAPKNSHHDQSLNALHVCLYSICKSFYEHISQYETVEMMLNCHYDNMIISSAI